MAGINPFCRSFFDASFPNWVRNFAMSFGLGIPILLHLFK
jgi:hypothetical protein